jgi:hypothetical protein
MSHEVTVYLTPARTGRFADVDFVDGVGTVPAEHEETIDILCRYYGGSTQEGLSNVNGENSEGDDAGESVGDGSSLHESKQPVAARKSRRKLEANGE